jgi:hypothetical protein
MHRRGKGPRRAIVAWIAALALASLGLFTGCGDDSSSAPGTGTAVSESGASGTPGPNASTGLTMPEFIAAADAICEEENARIKPRSEAIRAEGGGTESQGGLDAIADDFRSLGTEIEEGIARLRGLAPPRGKVKGIESMLDIAGSQAVLSDSVADAIAASDSAKIESLNEQIELNQAKYRGLAQGLGFHQCGAG